MKKIFIFLSLLMFFVSCGSSKSVSYLHKPLAAEGCEVTYSVVQQDSELDIVVTVKSDRLVFGDYPTLLFKNFDGETLRLEGINVQANANKHTSGIIVNNLILPVSSTEITAIAIFPVNPEDIQFFKSGITKVRLTTIPIVHEKDFSWDKIGEYLYSELNKVSQNTF